MKFSICVSMLASAFIAASAIAANPVSCPSVVDARIGVRSVSCDKFTGAAKAKCEADLAKVQASAKGVK